MPVASTLRYQPCHWVVLALICCLATPGAGYAQVINPATSPKDTALVAERQEVDVQSAADSNKVFANPSVLGMGPSKGILVRYETAPRFKVTSTSDQLGAGNDQVRRLNVSELKLYAPLWNRPHLKFVLGFNYSRQQFNFDGRGKSDLYPLYRVLDDRNLRTIGSQLLMLRPVDGRRYFLFRVKGELNGDYKQDAEDGQYRRQPLEKYLRTSAEFFYGWKKSPTYSVAIGAQVGYTFGRRSIYPAVILNRTWNDRWGFEGLLPAKARIRYNASEKMLFYGGYEVQGDSYTINIDGPPVPPAVSAYNRTVELRVTSLNTRLRVERELLPVLWMAVDVGWRYYASFNVYDSSSQRHELIANSLRSSAMLNVELFLTPPRRLLKQ